MICAILKRGLSTVNINSKGIVAISKDDNIILGNSEIKYVKNVTVINSTSFKGLIDSIKREDFKSSNFSIDNSISVSCRNCSDLKRENNKVVYLGITKNNDQLMYSVVDNRLRIISINNNRVINCIETTVSEFNELILVKYDYEYNIEYVLTNLIGKDVVLYNGAVSISDRTLLDEAYKHDITVYKDLLQYISLNSKEYYKEFKVYSLFIDNAFLMKSSLEMCTRMILTVLIKKNKILPITLLDNKKAINMKTKRVTDTNIIEILSDSILYPRYYDVIDNEDYNIVYQDRNTRYDCYYKIGENISRSLYTLLKDNKVIEGDVVKWSVDNIDYDNYGEVYFNIDNKICIINKNNIVELNLR